ncbi:MAG: prolipoprotein diacylglyceryl transferase [Victivallales bacterium]|nr:prolipoprotein diacylglyceryl transferase [Victivallales bacterium]
MICLPNPEFIRLGPLTIRWYGFFAAVSALVSYFLLMRRAKRFNLTEQQVLDVMVVCVLGGVIGARLEYVRRFWDAFYANDFMGIFRVWEGGLVFQGGFILVVLILIAMCHLRKWSLGDIADLTAPVLPIAHAIARLGCLFNGCCFGVPATSPLCVQYPAMGNDVLHQQIAHGVLKPDAVMPLPVVPVQLLESLVCLAIAGLIYYLERKKRLTHRRFLVYVLLYSVARVALEFLRGDYPQHTGLTPAQWTTLLVVLPITIAIIAFLTWRHRSIVPPTLENAPPAAGKKPRK